MSLYQRINATTGLLVGEPGPLPANLVGLKDESLADLEQALGSTIAHELGFGDTGFLPVPPPEAEPPPVRRDITRILFLQRIPAPARIAIRTAGKTNPIIEDFLDLISATDTINLDAADTLAGVGYMQSQGLLTEGEAGALLA